MSLSANAGTCTRRGPCHPGNKQTARPFGERSEASLLGMWDRGWHAAIEQLVTARHAGVLPSTVSGPDRHQPVFLTVRSRKGSRMATPSPLKISGKVVYIDGTEAAGAKVKIIEHDLA